MKIIIRADGGTSIGMGHIMRTSVLAISLSSVFEIVYASIDNEFNKQGIEYVNKQGFNTIKLNQNNYLEQLCDQEADILITDNYFVDEEYFNKTKSYFKYTGYIDDNNYIPYYNVDFILNQNIYASELDYRTNLETKLFLGTRYVLLRDEFRRINEKQIDTDIKSIMVTTGGSDPNNDTLKILKQLEMYDKNVAIHIAVGNSFTEICKEKIDILASKNKNFNVHRNANMSKLMQVCDVAIAGCGSTLYELAACATPTIGIIIADNQTMAANRFEKDGIIIKSFSNQIISSLNTMTFKKRRYMSQLCKSIVNVNGSDLLTKELQTMIK